MHGLADDEQAKDAALRQLAALTMHTQSASPTSVLGYKLRVALCVGRGEGASLNCSSSSS